MLSIKSNEAEENAQQKFQGKDTADLKDFDDDYDDDDQDIPLLKFNPFTLRLNSVSNKYKKEELEDQINKHNRYFSLGTIFCLLIVHLVQTAIFIALQADYPNEFSNMPAIIALRFIFAFALCVILTFDKKFTRRRIKGVIGFIVFTLGLVVSVIHADFTDRSTYKVIQAIEFMFIYEVGIHAA